MVVSATRQSHRVTGAVRGQVMAEFAMVCLLVVLVLLVPWVDDRSPAEQLLQAVVSAAASFRQWLLVV